MRARASDSECMQSVRCARRGMATFEEGLPWKETNTFRFIFGAREGLVGVYPVSATGIFYFCAFPAPRVRGRPQGHPCIRLILRLQPCRNRNMLCVSGYHVWFVRHFLMQLVQHLCHFKIPVAPTCRSKQSIGLGDSLCTPGSTVTNV